MTRLIDTWRMDKTAWSLESLTEQGRDRQYWLSRDPRNDWLPSNLRGRFTMDTTHLPPDFREFIQFMNSAGVEWV